jgi:hypothetical protein
MHQHSEGFIDPELAGHVAPVQGGGTLAVSDLSDGSLILVLQGVDDVLALSFRISAEHAPAFKRFFVSTQ